MQLLLASKTNSSYTNEWSFRSQTGNLKDVVFKLAIPRSLHPEYYSINEYSGLPVKFTYKRLIEKIN